MQPAWEDPQHEDWLAASAALRRVAVRLSGRTDIVVRLQPGLGVPPSGRFRHPQGEILLDAALLLRSRSDTPADLAMGLGSGAVPVPRRKAQARLLAALTLQAAHAAHTRWDPDAARDQVRRWVQPLEHARVAGVQTGRRPDDGPSLRAALDLLIGVTDDSTSAAWLVNAVTARAWAAAGVMSMEEAASTVHRMRLRIGLDVDRKVAHAISRAVAADDDDVTEVLDAADLLSRMLDQSRPDESVGAGDQPRASEDVIATRSARVTLSAGGDQQKARRLSGRERRELAAGQRENALAAANRAGRLRPSDLAATPEPNDELRRTARAATQDLRRALSTVQTSQIVPSVTPPGRLRMPELMRRQSQIATRAPLTARPWRQLRRTTITPPRVSVGLSLDGSRSHLPIHSAMSELVWLLATASRNAAAEVAAVSWNNRVSVLVRPGEAPRQVLEPRCHGSSTACPESLRALTGLLGLNSHDGIRIVVVASDGRLPNRAATADEVSSLSESGVAVAWVSPTPGGWCPPDATPILADPTRVVRTITTLIAQSADRWLERAAPPRVPTAR